MYFPRNREFGSALSQLRNFGEGLNPPNAPSRYATRREGDYSTQFSAENKNVWSYNSTPYTFIVCKQGDVYLMIMHKRGQQTLVATSQTAYIQCRLVLARIHSETIKTSDLWMHRQVSKHASLKYVRCFSSLAKVNETCDQISNDIPPPRYAPWTRTRSTLKLEVRSPPHTHSLCFLLLPLVFCTSSFQCFSVFHWLVPPSQS
jgi:hypothetical protein